MVFKRKNKATLASLAGYWVSKHQTNTKGTKEHQRNTQRRHPKGSASHIFLRNNHATSPTH